MNWDSPADFFSMGGYGLFVWGSYAAAAIVATLEPWLASRRRRRALREACQSVAVPRDGGP